MPTSINFHRHSTMPAAVIITRTPSPQKEKVAFAQNPVQSISRPVNAKEHHAINNFENHAAHCRDCHRPYEAYQEGYKLCKDGNRLAREVASTLYNINDVTYSKGTDQQLERVEIQPIFHETRGLLKANERSVLRYRRPFVIPRRSSHAVKPQLLERRKSVKIEQPARSQSTKTKRYSNSNIVEWPEQTHRTIYVHRPSTHKRGSLYAEDLAQRTQDAQRYNVEVRVPNNRASGYYG